MNTTPLILVMFCCGVWTADASEPGAITYAREIYPLLRRACLECHGANKKQGGLRLDRRNAAMAGGDSGAVIVQGDPAKSELLRRISLPKSDPDVMPNRGDVLTAAEVDRIRQWIAGGADWPDNVQPDQHWAYVPPVRPQMSKMASHPIDGFVFDRLTQEGLASSPTAEPEILVRRLYFDLIGLPPTPTVVDNFLAGAQRDLPRAIDALVNELLASPQFGEKWARSWLDAARYADSHGFQRDDLRDIWPYRDWVIRAINDDMPFNQFTIEQLAGDLLPNPTEAQQIATGFNRCAPCNVEAGTDPEENRVNQVFDRVNTLGTVWLGTTLECCQCHDHKYDPFTMPDYYGLFAFFNQTEIEAERSNPKVPGSIRFLGPYLSVTDRDHDEKRAQLVQEITATKAALETLKKHNDVATTKPPAYMTHVFKPDDFESTAGADHRVLDDGSILLQGDPPDSDTYTVTVRTGLKGIVGFKLETLTDPSLPGMGPGRGDPQRTNFILNEFRVTALSDGAQKPRSLSLTGAIADFSQPKWEVAGAIDGDPKTGWAIAPQFHQSHWALFRVANDVVDGASKTLTFTLVQKYGSARTIGRLRLSAITGEYPSAATSAVSNPTAQELQNKLAVLDKTLIELGKPQTLVMKEIEQPRVTKLLQRGDFRNPGADIPAAVPAILPSIPTNSGHRLNRLDLARWLMHRENPLVARVTVNRIWAELFQEGLVSTPEDFGIKGDRPSHADLLDWLAVEFMENGWSRKRLLKTIVTSQTYQQSSRIPAALLERDPHNRLLARGPRFRLSAELIRDNVLSISGFISLTQFGPPIRPPQPPGLWDKVGGEKYDYVVSPGEQQHRRGIYVVLKRMSPYPSFISFDATARLACRVKRPRSNTPLQALVLLNDPVYVDAARALAKRIPQEANSTDLAGKLRYAFRLTLARQPKEAELATLAHLYNSELESNGGRQEDAWFAIASALLNLDETVTRN